MIGGLIRGTVRRQWRWRDPPMAGGRSRTMPGPTQRSRRTTASSWVTIRAERLTTGGCTASGRRNQIPRRGAQLCAWASRISARGLRLEWLLHVRRSAHVLQCPPRGESPETAPYARCGRLLSCGQYQPHHDRWLAPAHADKVAFEWAEGARPDPGSRRCRRDRLRQRIEPHLHI